MIVLPTMIILNVFNAQNTSPTLIYDMDSAKSASKTKHSTPTLTTAKMNQEQLYGENPVDS